MLYEYVRFLISRHLFSLFAKLKGQPVKASYMRDIIESVLLFFLSSKTVFRFFFANIISNENPNKTYNLWFEWWLDFSFLQRFPVDLLMKEGMNQDGALKAMCCHASQPLGRLFCHKLKTPNRNGCLRVLPWRSHGRVCD